MKRILARTFAAVIAFSMLAFAGCGQEEVQDRGTMGDMCVSFIDVGKGDCILLQAGESAALIDTGYDETSDEVLSYLRKQGVSRLDCLVITHYDRDHVGGLSDIGKALDIDKVYLPGYTGSDKNYQMVMSAIDDLRLDAQPVTAKQHLKLGDADLDVFPSSLKYTPGTKGKEGNDNDLSLVTTLTGAGGSYLFAGDLEEDGIEAFLKEGHGRFDVLKFPHHGKKASNTDELIEDVRPQIAIITDCDDDPADKKAVKLLEKNGVDVYRTSISGTIVVRNDGEGRYSVE